MGGVEATLQDNFLLTGHLPRVAHSGSRPTMIDNRPSFGLVSIRRIKGEYEWGRRASEAG